MKFKTLLHHLNRRDHRLLPKNTIFTKILLGIFITSAVVFSVKAILAAGTVSETTTIPSYLNKEIVKEIADKQTSLEDDNINSENWIKASAVTNGFLVVNTLVGTDTVNMVTANSSWTPTGLIGLTNKTIASLYNPPISGVEYIADSVNNFLGKPVYADESGFSQLTGIQPLWKICRNTVYTFVSIIFVAMGLMIMLRIKISPQATVTIQNSIPKIITTLILVTFSYAIVGLIIDFTYLIQAILLSILIKSDPTLSTGLPEIADLIKGSGGTFFSLVMITMFSTTSVGTVVFSILSGAVGAIIGFVAAGGVFGGLTVIGLIIGISIILIFALIQLLKFFFGCAKAYIILLLKIISAPLEIALGAFPNSKIGFSSWFIQTIAYALVFPICLLFLVVLNIITKAVSFNQVWTPGILQGPIITSAIKPLLGIAGLMLLSKLPNLIPEAIFQLKPSPFGKALGEGFKKFPGVGMFAAGVGVAKSGINFYAGQKAQEFMGNTKFGGWVNKQQAKATERRAEREEATNPNKTPVGPESDN